MSNILPIVVLKLSMNKCHRIRTRLGIFCRNLPPFIRGRLNYLKQQIGSEYVHLALNHILYTIAFKGGVCQIRF